MKAIIIEDEYLIAEDLKEGLQAIAPDIEVLEVLPSIYDGRAWFSENEQPDLMFMDVKLSDGLSFELFDHVQITCPIIFCTAYEEYAIRAFKVNGVDYLLKPVQEDDLAKAIAKVRSLRQGNSAIPPDLAQLVKLFTSQAADKPHYKERFILNMNNRWIPVDTKDIAVIYRENLNYFYKFSGEKLIHDFSPLEDIEAVLDPDMFFRANRQTIININAVHNFKTGINQKLMVYLKPPLKLEVDVSRDKASQLKKWMDR